MTTLLMGKLKKDMEFLGIAYFFVAQISLPR